MRGAYDVTTVRAAEGPLLQRLPAGTLMSRAAAGLAATCARLLDRVYGANVVLLVGKGDNGGDALHAGARLARRGARVTALLLGPAHPGGLAALRAGGGRIRHAGEDFDRRLIGTADLVIDGMLGIGGVGGLRADAARLAELAANSHAPVVAVDVPSGVDASTGEVPGPAVSADVTVTFGALKIGLVVAPGAHYAGLVELVDIGLELPAPQAELLDVDDVARLVPHPPPETDKYRRGVLGVVAGSEAYTGAAVLAVGGALATGPGMVRFAGVGRAADAVRARWPEAIVTSIDDAEAVRSIGRVQAWVVGPGLGTDAAAAALVHAVLDTDLPVLVDADGLSVVGDHLRWVHGRRAPTVLTPHAGELARMTRVDRSDIEARRVHHARALAADVGAVVLLKGSTTVIAAPDGGLRVDTAGSPYLGTAGSGDVLSGIIGALLAGGLDAFDAASAGCLLHSLAGLVAQGRPAAPITATDLITAIPETWRTVRR